MLTGLISYLLLIDTDTQDPDATTGAEQEYCQDTVQPSDVKLWTTQHVKLWLIKEGFEEEVRKFEGMSHIYL